MWNRLCKGEIREALMKTGLIVPELGLYSTECCSAELVNLEDLNRLNGMAA